ncbi:hypothetical protein LPB85_08900 [Chryseobacterium sp. LC2016-27]|uniref:hypothetical protein n=1 Tax=Chryseobacterium sp. LC2016-27 TaxID=2897326 RepID=UPI001E601AC3|nr:hypothetical protein [Chryseobacterium sp. LC2016-27]MCD0455567.1 hypothetical protein [Chryseobacterium sp. LC2016-27]
MSFLLFFLIGCKKSNTSEIININVKDSVKTQNSTKVNDNSKEQSDSFVISCGSGCAMTYNLKNVKDLGNIKEVRFEVETYIDEVLSETNDETYLFYYNQSNQIEKIQHKGEKENILENLLPNAVNSFKNFAGKLVNDTKINTVQDTKSINNNEKLPYNKTINLKTIKYNVLDSGYFKGITKFICDSNNPRYLPLPQKDDIEVILVPQDCGDFPYRFYLLTIKNNNVIGNLYVEGEWHEPDDEENTEVSSFSIDKNYNIKVETKFLDSFKSDIYKISDNGKIIKQ